jgi:pyrroline-5-carboxylate reductase
MRIGFIGSGTITRAVVTGLLKAKAPFEHLCLSPRNGEIASALAGLDSRIRVCATNQEVLDNSDTVCLAVVPQISAEVLRALHFGSRHHVISFIAGVSIAELRRLTGDGHTIVRAVPLPAVAATQGSTAICPPDEVARLLFTQLGTPVEVADERQFDALSAVTATMASFYAVLEAQAQWLAAQGIDYRSARAFLSGHSVGLAHETTCSDKPFSKLIEESMTPGGINEQLHKELSVEDAYSRYAVALDKVLKRVTRG